jgi:hypothetical protein
LIGKCVEEVGVEDPVGVFGGCGHVEDEIGEDEDKDLKMVTNSFIWFSFLF